MAREIILIESQTVQVHYANNDNSITDRDEIQKSDQTDQGGIPAATIIIHVAVDLTTLAMAGEVLAVGLGIVWG